MLSFKALTKIISQAYTGGALRSTMWQLGFGRRDTYAKMYLKGEHPEYIARAALVLMETGA